MKAERTEYQLAVDSIKFLLKQQGLSYRELGKMIGLSESGVKKALGARDGSFQRITQIARHLGVSLADLLRGADERMSRVQYGRKQQDYLLSDKRAFKLYWALVYEREPLEAAEKTAGLSGRATFSVLRQLDQLNLLSLLPGGRIRVPPIKPIKWVGQGPLVEWIFKDWSLRLVRDVATPTPTPGSFFLLRYFKVKPETYAEFLTAFQRLEMDFVRRAMQDMRTGSKDLVHMRWILGADSRSFVSE